MSGNPLSGRLSTATAILTHLLSGQPAEYRLLVESIDPDDRLALIEAFALAWIWTTTGYLRASGQTETQAWDTALTLARGLTLDLAADGPGGAT